MAIVFEHTAPGRREQHPLTAEAVAYAWQQLARRAGIEGTASDSAIPGEVQVLYELPRATVGATRSITIVPCADNAWWDLLALSPGSLDWVPIDEALPDGTSLDPAIEIPVLFWGEGCDSSHHPFAELQGQNSVVFYADILAATFFMLSRWEETVAGQEDEHGRQSALGSVSYKQGFLDWPLVDLYALVLRGWLQRLAPDWKPHAGTFSVQLSHDIDQLTRRFRTPGAFVRTLGGDLLRRRNLGLALQTVADALAQVFAPSSLCYARSIDRFVTLSLQHGFGDDVFFIKTAQSATYDDNDYSVASPKVRERIARLKAKGFAIGLHPGYWTLGDPQRLRAEKSRLDAVLGSTAYGARQHYLRFRVPDSWRDMSEAGLTYDASAAYADHEGFRCGTCHPYRPFDVEQNRVLDIVEVPLIAMDATLINYRKLDPDAALARILELAERCRLVEGVFTLLWHNTMLCGTFRQWASTYERALGALAAMMVNADSAPAQARCQTGSTRQR